MNLDLTLNSRFMSIIFITKLTNKVLLLRRIKPCMTIEMRKLYYNSYSLPIIDYGIILWQSAPKHKHTQPLQSRITYHVALLGFKIHNDLALNYLNTILLFTSNSLYELRSQCNLAQPIKKS